MIPESSVIERRVRLPKAQVDRLREVAQRHQLSEDQVVAKALDILFSLADVFDSRAERHG